MKFTIAICLIFTHYVCGAPCIVEKDTCVTTFTNVNFSNFYSDTRPSAISTTEQTINKTTRIIYNKRFVKKYRKAQRLLTNCLQSNAIDDFFYNNKATQNIRVNTHAFNRWLPAYLSLFTLFRI